MRGLRPPARDIGVGRAPRWVGPALLGAFAAILLVLAFLERLGAVAIPATPTIAGAALALVAAVALFAPARRPSDYYVADREVAPRHGGTMAAVTLAGLLGAAAASGLLASGADLLTATAGSLGGLLLIGVLVAPRLRRFGGHTPTDFLGARFGFPARLAGAAVAFVSSFLLLTASLSIAGPLLASYLGLTGSEGMLAAAAVTALAVLPGGMRSLAAVQGVQYVLALFGCLVPVAVMAFARRAAEDPAVAAGFGWLQAEVPAGSGALAAVAVPALFAALQTSALPPLLAQGPSAPSGRRAMASFGWAIVFSLLLLSAALLFGRAALEAAGAPADAIAGELIFSEGPPLGALPPLLGGLAAAGILAMLLPLGQASLFSASSALSHDLWDEIAARRGAVGRRIFAARLLSAAVAAAAAWLAGAAILDPGALLVWGIALAAAGSLAPLLLGLWWRRCNAVGALAGTCSGAGIVAISFAIDPQGAVAANAGAIGLAGAFAATIAGSLITAPPAAERADLPLGLGRRGSVSEGSAAGLAPTPRGRAAPS